MGYMSLFQNLWDDYIQITPSAKKVHSILSSGTDIVNDHIALRTFNTEKVSLDKLAQHFEKHGYTAKEEYFFKAKKLYAKHYEHPDENAPRVFISHLLLEQCSVSLQGIIHKLIDKLPEDVASKDDFLYSGTHWSISSDEYQNLLQESEYAAWMSAWGYHANHFTVSVNKLEKFQDIRQVNEALKSQGFSLNTTGGEIKGSKEVHLEQSSTMADKVVCSFADKKLEIPSCFYEFAQRHLLPNGKLYSGFVEASADKIFESTNVKK